MNDLTAKLKAAWGWFSTDHSLSATLMRDLEAYQHSVECEENPEKSDLYE